MNTKHCAVCGRPIEQFTAGKGRWTRRDRRTCSPRCRKRLQRGTLKRSFKKNPARNWPHV